MFLIFLSFIIFICFISTFIFSYFFLPSRLSIFLSSVFTLIKSVLTLNINSFLFILLFFSLICINLLGNIPLIPISSIYYSFTVTLSLVFWVSIMICVFNTQLVDFLAHIMPYGSPISLGLFLPLVEIFSQLIRPFTLIIRLSTNLSSGHIMIFMFSYFTSLSSLLSPVIFLVLSLLLILEFCISLLQAYIFVSLITLYINETI